MFIFTTRFYLVRFIYFYDRRVKGRILSRYWFRNLLLPDTIYKHLYMEMVEMLGPCASI